MNAPCETFDEALAAAAFEERGKQRDVFDAFRAGKHVILHAPTGWGKTFAVLAALGAGHGIYSLPMRSLVDSVAEEADGLGLMKCAAQHGERREHELLDQGDDPEAPTECVFTTLDQTLSAFLGIPVGVSRRQGNVMPAVVDASHLVFDEFHLFEPERSWATALSALQRSRQNGIILTATLSDVMVAFLEEHLADSEVGAVEVVRGKRPFVNTKTALRGAGLDEVEQIKLGRRTLIIRNQVEWAQQTAEALRERADVEGDVHLLHSELLPEDRERIEEQMRGTFGEDSSEPGVLVATQVVEAGLDITCDVMHTDLCPPSAFVQRIGRCARYKGETGRIFLHPVESAAPYTQRESEMEALRQFIGDEQDIASTAEQKIVNLAKERDREIIQTFQDDKSNPEEEVRRSRVTADYSGYRRHIRDINSLNVAIGWKSEEAPNKFIGVSRSKFYKEDGKYGSARVTFVRYDSDREAEEYVEQPHEADYALLNPEHARYDRNYGIRVGEPSVGENRFVGEEKTAGKNFSHDAEEAEPYCLHIQRLKGAQPVPWWIVERLAANEKVRTRENAQFLVDFVTWAHDLGKLNYQWQAAFGVSPDDTPIAHSGGDYDAKEGVKRPPHGWMSAWAAMDYIIDTFEDFGPGVDLRKAVFWAIADHHGYSHKMKRTSLTSFELGYLDHLDRMPERMAWVRPEWNSSILTTSVSSGKLEAIHRAIKQSRRKKSDANEVYFALSHVLRRTDWRATSVHFTEEEEEEETDKNKDEGNPRCL